jgi:pyridoxamine 5'-phosphate oxidase
MTVDPIATFLADRERARAANEPWDAASTALATVGHDARPSVRFVLAKEVDHDGFWFFTNYESRKAAELDANPHAALAFHFHTITVQYRVEGTVTRAPNERSDAYFGARPRESQLGAWASAQSQPLSEPNLLGERLKELDAKYPSTVPRPPHWGGYLLVPDLIERWTEGPHRLHRRTLYTRVVSGWKTQELQP